MTRVDDPLVVALAEERIFLCEGAEIHFRPTQSDTMKKKGDAPELPLAALQFLRLTFKSLSNKIKQRMVLAAEEDANLMVKYW